MKLIRGVVVLCRVPMPSERFKTSKLRPALIVSKDLNNQRLADVTVAICTSNTSRALEPTQYLITGDEISEAGIKVASVVKCESLLTIHKAMIVKPLGKLSKTGLHQVNLCLKDALGLS